MTYARATLNVKLTVTWQVHCVTANLATFLSGHTAGACLTCRSEWGSQRIIQ